MIWSPLKHQNASLDIRGHFFESTPDAILVLDNGRFIECNAAALKIFGLRTKQDLFNTTPSRLSPAKQDDGQASDRRLAR